METMSVDRKNYFDHIAKNFYQQSLSVKIPFRYRFNYWLYYVLLARKGTPVHSTTQDALYADGRLKRGYEKYLAKINQWICQNYPETEHHIQIPTFNADEIKESEVPYLMNLRIPFVLKGGTRDLKMMDWDLDYFEQNFGDCDIPINTAPDKPAQNKFEKTKASNYYDFRPGKVKEVIDSIKQGGNLRSVAVEDVMHQQDGRLISDLNIPKFERMSGWIDYQHDKLKSRFRVGHILSKQLFLQPSYAYTVWHLEPGDNFFLLNSGHKTWTMAHPYYSAAFFPRVKKTTTYHGSSIDVREDNEAQRQRGYDAYTRIPKLQFDVEPGDIVRLPNYWWHTVETHAEQYAIAVTLRASCMPNTTSIAYLILRMLDEDYHQLVKRIQQGGRVTDEDVDLKIFSDLDQSKN
ncbi:cupin-like domain-containing protein [Aliikangiella maris]|uniref:Cupin-like domain-containing protein n=2 Tax=Aliikangiella maris TaxID=3162458 RepID=A0ABV2BRS2_9GAMM